MSSYGLVAVLAVRIIIETGECPASAWRQAVIEVIPNNRLAREKGCPKGAFLGLCEEGYVKGVAPGRYHRGYKMNKIYALRTVELLISNPEIAGDVEGLWGKVVSSSSIRHFGQAEVVVELWNNGYIVGRPQII
ncbi:MAG: hypothetical protein Q8N36_03910 [bacterium]|nr:hypothetical protein [bacterium]